MKIIVAYDISDNGVREVLAKFLMRNGLSRVQRSLFIGKGSGQLIKDIERYASKIVDPEKDCIHIFIMNDNEYLQTRIIGKPWSESREIVQGVEVF